jgi:hypothetical protein
MDRIYRINKIKGRFAFAWSNPVNPVYNLRTRMDRIYRINKIKGRFAFAWSNPVDPVYNLRTILRSSRMAGGERR